MKCHLKVVTPPALIDKEEEVTILEAPYHRVPRRAFLDPNTLPISESKGNPSDLLNNADSNADLPPNIQIALPLYIQMVYLGYR